MHTRRFWEQASAEVDAGERIATVAGRKGVRPRTLTWWRWKLKSEKRVKPQFLPVIVRERVQSPTAVEVVVGDVTVRVPVGTDVAYVASVTSALRRRC